MFERNCICKRRNLLAALLAGAACVFGGFSAAAQEEAAPSIVTTIFPEYDWVTTILGDNPASAEVTMLLENGVDLHSYQPTAADMLKLSQCDLFIYVGGESDRWVEDALAEAVNEEMVVLNLLDVMGDRAKEEELVEGMEQEHEPEPEQEQAQTQTQGGEKADMDEEAGMDAGSDMDSEEDVEYDEHVWLSLRNASYLCGVIEEALAGIDPAHAEDYAKNLEAYQAQLEALDAAYTEAVDQAALHTVLFGDRFPFRYLTEDYGLSYYAAFAGCSAEAEASFETVIFLTSKLDELGLPAILTIENSDHRIAKTIRQASSAKNQEILELHSMQSVSSEEVAQGASYLEFMQSNLEVLKTALGG